VFSWQDNPLPVQVPVQVFVPASNEQPPAMQPQMTDILPSAPVTLATGVQEAPELQVPEQASFAASYWQRDADGVGVALTLPRPKQYSGMPFAVVAVAPYPQIVSEHRLYTPANFSFATASLMQPQFSGQTEGVAVVVTPLL
jgi:hypothetical protein